MEQYTKLTGASYSYTETPGEIEKKVVAHVAKNFGIDLLTLAQDKLICAAWTDRIGSRGTFYVVVTENGVIVRKSNDLKQTLFKDIVTIEKSPMLDTVLITAGGKTDLFSLMLMPKKELLEKMFGKISQRFNNRPSPGAQQQPSFNALSSVADEIKKFADLRGQGVITEDEFQAKKKQLLGA